MKGLMNNVYEDADHRRWWWLFTGYRTVSSVRLDGDNRFRLIPKIARGAAKWMRFEHELCGGDGELTDG